MQQSEKPENHMPQVVIPADNSWWLLVKAFISQPTAETIQTISSLPDAKPQRAYLWVYCSMLFYGFANSLSLGNNILTSLLLGFSLIAVLGLVNFIIQNWLFQRVAMLYGGRDDAYANFHFVRGIFFPIITIMLALVVLMGIFAPNIAQMIGIWLMVADMWLTALVMQHINDFSTTKSLLITGALYIIQLSLFTFILPIAGV